MEFFIELILELIFEGSLEASQNKKIPKFIRYPLIFLIIAFFISVIGIILLVSIISYKENIMLSILFMLIALIMIVSGIIKFKKIYLKKNK